jgi:Rho GDP-dissociation inhibitor
MSDQDPPKVEDDLTPSSTAGYKAPAQKTVEELKNLDQNDESLNKWKESLLKNAAAAKSGDSRKVVVLALAMEVAGRPDVVLDLSTPGKTFVFGL